MRLTLLIILSLAFNLTCSENEHDKTDHCKDENNIQDTEQLSETSAEVSQRSSLSSTLGDMEIQIKESKITMNIYKEGHNILSAHLGIDLPPELGEPTSCKDETDKEEIICWNWGMAAQFQVTEMKIADEDESNCYDITWQNPQHISYRGDASLSSMTDCFLLEDETYWFVGPEEYHQHFPMRYENKRSRVAYVPGDMLQNNETYFGGVVEPYWLLSNGIAIWVPSGTPLFYSWNEGNEVYPNEKLMCLQAKNVDPYPTVEQYPELGNPAQLRYTVCRKNDPREMHMFAVKHFLGKPKNTPDERMLVDPIWSTWAQFKTNINQSAVIEFAENIQSYGFSASQIEIDDNWEACYGDAEFDRSNNKFPEPRVMVDQIKRLENAPRVTLWIHPFINMVCGKSWTEAAFKGFLIKDMKNVPQKEGFPDKFPGNTYWWQGVMAGYIDFTNPAAVDWWKGRLNALHANYGIDSFKFDAGEVNWMPSSHQLNKTLISDWPVAQTKKYVEAVASSASAYSSNLIEVRVGSRTQTEPVFVRMLDKDSFWGYENGIKTLITTLLQISMSGYPFVLPDMIGGNGYSTDDPLDDSNPPTKELYLRWLEANVFMPGMQFSFVPWQYDEEVVEITLRMIALRNKYSSLIVDLAKEAAITGAPINRPIWWIDPTNKEAMKIDSEFLLGDSILVAPILEEGAVSRDIYLPNEVWKDENNPENIHFGPKWIKDYSADIGTLPFFTRVE